MVECIKRAAWLAPVLAGCTALTPVSGALAAASDIKFAPHRAIYDITLSRSAPGSGVNDMTGRLVYELTGGACEDYAQSMRFVTQSSSSDGTEQINDMRTTSSEEITGSRLKFQTTQLHDDQSAEVTEGNAGRRGASGEVKIELTRPEAKAMSLPAATYFPIQHSIALLDAAKAGKSRFEADVYDGSEKGDKVSATITLIGKGRQSEAAELASVTNAALLKGIPFWPISTSYFEKGKSLDTKDSLPTYEMSAHFYENGVSTRLVMDYGDFALKGELKQLTFLPEPKCAAK
jgi:EipB-like